MEDPDVHGIGLDLALGDQGLVDIMVLQWHTPDPDPTNGLKIPAGIADDRGQILANLRQWLANTFEQETEPRPLFVVAPELSLPTCHRDLARQIVGGLNRPAVLIAGLEYLHWDEYLELLNSLGDMPAQGRWREGGGESRVVNVAGIWIREESGAVRTFIQRKRNPANPEVAGFAPGYDVLLFRSNNQNPGSRLNFCVQICADFASADCVEGFRRGAVAAVQPSIPLDITCVVQHNRSDEPDQFRQASQAYFAPPNGMIVTADSCLVFANNASAHHGKSDIWGRSMFRVHFQRITRPPRDGLLATATYWQKDRPAFGHQEVILRESGPGLYRFVYKPVYLCDPTPGHGEPRPFPGEQTGFAPLNGTDFGYEDGTCFRSIPAVINYLDSEWAEGLRSDVPEFLRANGADIYDVHSLTPGKKELAEAYQLAFQAGVKAWRDTFNWQDAVACVTVHWYLLCLVTKRWVEQLEPNSWPAGVAVAVKRFMITYSLMSLGRGGFDTPSLQPTPNTGWHATAGTGLCVTYLCGAGEIPAATMIVSFLQAMREKSPMALLNPTWLIVFVQPGGMYSRPRINEQLQHLRASVVEAAPPVNAGLHLVSGGEVTRVVDPVTFTLCDGELTETLNNAVDGASLRAGLAATIRSAISP